MAVEHGGVGVAHLVVVGGEVGDSPDESSMAKTSKVRLETGLIGKGEGAEGKNIIVLLLVGRHLMIKSYLRLNMLIKRKNLII